MGGKEFHFTWSRETGDLCDIYEERQSGEDGNGLLVESGCAWRKLNVQRVLDESAKNHVKRLSEEAERQLKSRKYVKWCKGSPLPPTSLRHLYCTLLILFPLFLPFISCCIPFLVGKFAAELAICPLIFQILKFCPAKELALFNTIVLDCRIFVQK